MSTQFSRALVLAAALGLAAGAGASERPDADPAAAGAAASSVVAPSPEALAALASVAPRPRSDAGGERCTADRAHCISAASYTIDICRTIEATARDSALDPHFFARLIWRESLFDAAALSPAGAEGIAQFIPETARRRGLRDSYNPAEALRASAAYLADLARDLGNIGLAAVAYNGGEARAERFVSDGGGLPTETRNYVQAITGHSAETWRDAPPASVDLTLAGEGGFHGACVKLASSRTLREFPSGPPLRAWGVVLASNRDRGGAERQVARLRNRHAAVLSAEPVSYTRGRRAGMAQSMHFAQVGRDSRPEAEALCGRLRAVGGDCMVLRN